jgi:TolA-binding protein
MSEAGWPQLPDDRHAPALAAHEAATSPLEVRVSRSGRYSRRGVALAVTIAVLLAAAGAGGYLTFVNKSRADRWEDRAVLLRANVKTLNAVVVRRTELLNQRVRQLNTMATKVKVSQAALAKSEVDVQGLEQRQRQLANEKAQLEDERAALTDVASKYITCKGDLENAIQAVANQDWGWINAYGSEVAGDCDAADSSLQGFLSAYPGE